MNQLINTGKITTDTHYIKGSPWKVPRIFLELPRNILEYSIGIF